MLREKIIICWCCLLFPVSSLIIFWLLSFMSPMLAYLHVSFLPLLNRMLDDRLLLLIKRLELVKSPSTPWVTLNGPVHVKLINFDFLSEFEIDGAYHKLCFGISYTQHRSTETESVRPRGITNAVIKSSLSGIFSSFFINITSACSGYVKL